MSTTGNRNNSWADFRPRLMKIANYWAKMPVLSPILIADSVMSGFYDKCKSEDCRDIRSILDIVLMAMERYTEYKKIQWLCTANLYFIVRSSSVTSAMNLKMKRKILSSLLNVMYALRRDTVVARNSCLILCQFELPADVVRSANKPCKLKDFILKHNHLISEI